MDPMLEWLELQGSNSVAAPSAPTEALTEPPVPQDISTEQVRSEGAPAAAPQVVLPHSEHKPALAATAAPDDALVDDPYKDHPGRRFHHTNDYYCHWVPQQARRFEPVRARRGQQVAPVSQASICTGASPEDRVMWLHEVGDILQYVCDNEPRCFWFVDGNNKVRPNFYFADFKALARDGRSEDLLNDGQMTDRPNVRIHYKFGGISCKVYTFARVGRGADWTGHKDLWMLEGWLKQLDEEEPDRSALENVLGFLKADKTGTNGSPLFRLLQRAKQMGLHSKFIFYIVVVPGNTWSKWSRRRVFILAFKRATNDLNSINLCIAMIKDTPLVVSLLCTIYNLGLAFRWSGQIDPSTGKPNQDS